jgi:hypothetical protein
MIAAQIKQQKPADQLWLDETGMRIPYNRVKPYERLNERKLAVLAKSAIDLNTRLTAFKATLKETAEELYHAFLEGNNGKAPGKGKGGITLFNFNRSIKVEVDINDNIVLDEAFINLAKAEFDDVLNDAISDAKEWFKPILMDAFETSGGRLDYKKVLNLKRYKDRITDPRFHKAMDFIDKAIRKPSSTEYFRVWVRNEAGKYVDVQLNFSKI